MFNLPNFDGSNAWFEENNKILLQVLGVPKKSFETNQSGAGRISTDSGANIFWDTL